MNDKDDKEGLTMGLSVPVPNENLKNSHTNEQSIKKPNVSPEFENKAKAFIKRYDKCFKELSK